MNKEEFFQRAPSWLESVRNNEVAISSRIRLARNLADTLFPDWGGAVVCQAVWQRLAPVFCSILPASGGLVEEMKEFTELERQILFERHLISRELMAGKPGRGLAVSSDESTAVMVNEEDHIRLQTILPGLNLQQAWQQAESFDNELGAAVKYAQTDLFGHLTACPTNVGTGLRASVMLHLPALVLINEITQVIKAMNKLGLTVRGMWGEGTDAIGNMFQISNQITLGLPAPEIVARLEKVVLEIIGHEKNARQRLMDRREAQVRDQIGRSYGLLRYAYMLDSKEVLTMLSNLRLGVEIGILPELPPQLLDELMIYTQPAHLQQLEGKELKPKQRDLARARLIRTRLAPYAGPE